MVYGRSTSWQTNFLLGILTQRASWYLWTYSLAFSEYNQWRIRTPKPPEQLSSVCVRTKVTTLSFGRNCGSIEGRCCLEIFEISVKILEFTYTILSARRKLVSLNVPLDLWSVWFTSIWKKEEPIAIFRNFKTLRELLALVSTDPQV